MSALVLTSARALILGVAFGALYDVFRVLKCLLCVAKYGDKHRFAKIYSKGVSDVFPGAPGGAVSYVVTALFDVLYLSVVTVAFVLFLYAFNYGIFRWFILLSCFAGFFAYHFSAGRLLIKSVDAVSDLLRLVFNLLLYVLALPIKYLYFAFRKIYQFLFAPAVNKIKSRIDKIRNKRYTLKCIKELENFFEFRVEQ